MKASEIINIFHGEYLLTTYLYCLDIKDTRDIRMYVIVLYAISNVPFDPESRNLLIFLGTLG
jgi:hypothetical protein